MHVIDAPRTLIAFDEKCRKPGIGRSTDLFNAHDYYHGWVKEVCRHLKIGGDIENVGYVTWGRMFSTSF
jgi:hypothetical protein